MTSRRIPVNFALAMHKRPKAIAFARSCAIVDSRALRDAARSDSFRVWSRSFAVEKTLGSLATKELGMKAQATVEILRVFRDVPDPRGANVCHPLSDVMTISI